ncbi:MAG: DUF2652 domain-containing protein [Methylobacteriaceae bacterium]|nr:DUF2652 domain-containing protein [Methylobacteriaceae bacterium]
MAERAIILIPDISGFTGFTGATEIDHAAHIIAELLELIVASNETEFTLAEIEGDAVLFYRKGEPLRREQLVDQCLRMFANFHQRLRVIERDTICQCGACQTASNLTLKFIAHFGYVKEIRVAQFVKATGIDMIVAHRLLKNDIDANEYVLITEPCCSAVGLEGGAKLEWAKSSQTYATIGNVAYEFATLTDYRAQIPQPPAQPRFVAEKGDDKLEIVIEAPVKAVYQTLVNVDKRPEWLDGVDTIDREMTSERINMRHNCVFHGLKMINTAIFRDFSEERARYSEKVEIPEIGLILQAHYEMEPVGEGSTRLNFNVNWMGANLPADKKQGMMAGQAANFALFKKVCETNPA